MISILYNYIYIILNEYSYTAHNIICKINIMTKLYMFKKQINLEIEEIVTDETIFDYQRLIKMFDGEKNIPLRKNITNPIKYKNRLQNRGRTRIRY